MQAAKERDERWKTVDLLKGGIDDVKDAMSPLPPYEANPPSSSSIEALLTAEQLQILTSIYSTLSPTGAAVSSKTLVVSLHQSQALRESFGDLVVDGVCAGLRKMKMSR